MNNNISFSAILSFLTIMLASMLTSCSGESITVIGKNLDGVSYSFNNDKFEATATGYYVKDGEVFKEIILPADVEAGGEVFKVVVVADRAFVDGPWVSVEFGVNMRTIGSEAFKNCKDIKIVRIQGNTLPTLPENAFDPEVYENATLLIHSGVNVDATPWKKFISISQY